MPTTDPRIDEIRHLHAQAASLRDQIHTALADAPAKPEQVAAVALPEAGHVDDAEIALDRALDAETAGQGSAEQTDAAGRALLTTKMKLAKAETVRAAAIDVARRRHAAFERSVAPLRDELDKVGGAIDRQLLELETERHEQAAQGMRAAAVQFAAAVAMTAATAELLTARLRRVDPAAPMPVVTTDMIIALPFPVGTKAFADPPRLILNPKFGPLRADDFVVDPTPIRRRLQRELDEQLRPSPEVLSTIGA